MVRAREEGSRCRERGGQGEAGGGEEAGEEADGEAGGEETHAVPGQV